MTVKQTRCPFCHSAFYITSLQLNAYRGQARCGQCHQVFDATDNMVASNTANTQPSASVIPSSQENTVSTPAIAPVASVTSPAQSVQPILPSSPPPKAEAEIRYGDDDDDEDASLVFSDQQGLPEMNQPNSGSNKLPLINDVINEDFLTNNFDQMDRLKATELTQVESLHAAADESWINDLLNEEDNKKSKPQTSSTAPTKAKTPVAVPTSASIDRGVYSKLPDAGNQRKETDDDEEDLLSFLNRTGAVSMPLSADRSDLSTTKPASHRILTPSANQTKPYYMIGWGLMCLLMAGLLIGQYIYFNFEHLAISPKTSKMVERLCSMSGCQIPHMNEDELHIKKLQVIAANSLGQTTFKGQLSNSASMSQPFPALHLILKRNGKAIASQIVQPRQYLPDNLKTFTRLATTTPYPFEFAIKTKRSEFDSYSLEPQYR